MAGRPLNAEPKDNKDGTVSMRVPLANGSPLRRTIRFPSRVLGERYRSALLAVWGTELPLPDPELFQSVRQRDTAPKSDAFAAVALAWWKKFYPDDYENPETAEGVLHKINAHLIPFFAPRVDHISEITYDDCEEFVEFKAGRRSKPTVSGVVIAEARDFTLAEAAQWSQRHKSTIRKAWLGNRLPHAYRDKATGERGVVKVPVGDLIAAGLVPTNQIADVPYGYSRKLVNEMLDSSAHLHLRRGQ